MHLVPGTAGCQTPVPAERPVHPTAQQQRSAGNCWGCASIQHSSSAAPGLGKTSQHHHSCKGTAFVIRTMSISQVKTLPPQASYFHAVTVQQKNSSKLGPRMKLPES